MTIRETAKSIYWKAYGRTIFNPALPRRTESVLFLCLGNICRSPFAERIASDREGGSGRHRFHSAGIQGIFPRNSPLEAVEAARSYGIDLTGHQSKKLEERMMDLYDMFVVMDVWQFNYMKRHFAGHADRIYLLSLFGDGRTGVRDGYSTYNIKDPYGRGIQDFLACYERISNCTSGLLERLGEKATGTD